jgi:hypothetical protein
MRLQDMPPDIQQLLRHERRHRREHVNAVMAALTRGDAEKFYELILPYDGYPDFWGPLIKRIARDIPEVTPEIQQACGSR